MADLSTPEGKLVERLEQLRSVLARMRSGEHMHVIVKDPNWLQPMSEAADALSRIAAERDEKEAARIRGVTEATKQFARAQAAERERDELKAALEHIDRYVVQSKADAAKHPDKIGYIFSLLARDVPDMARAALRTPEESP